ncbi:MAG: arginine N-succinyltransferase [Rubrivivax sp.]|nr:arginine N-succinyltransferase [Rubrivivax sp.]
MRPGPRGAVGQLPFWQGPGRHLYSQDPAAALAQHGLAWRGHAASLQPRHLPYTSFLPAAAPAAAEAAIAQVQQGALLLREALEEAGLRYPHYVNVEDGGPILEAAVDDMPAVRQAQQL